MNLISTGSNNEQNVQKNGVSNFNFYNSDFVISSQKDLLDQNPKTNPNAFSSNNTTSPSDTFLSFLVIEVALLPDCEARWRRSSPWASLVSLADIVLRDLGPVQAKDVCWHSQFRKRGRTKLTLLPNSTSCSAISFCEQSTLTLYVVAIAPFLRTSCHPALANLLDLKTLDNASKLGLNGSNYVS